MPFNLSGKQSWRSRMPSLPNFKSKRFQIMLGFIFGSLALGLLTYFCRDLFFSVFGESNSEKLNAGDSKAVDANSNSMTANAGMPMPDRNHVDQLYSRAAGPDREKKNGNPRRRILSAGGDVDGPTVIKEIGTISVEAGQPLTKIIPADEYFGCAANKPECSMFMRVHDKNGNRVIKPNDNPGEIGRASCRERV